MYRETDLSICGVYYRVDETLAQVHGLLHARWGGVQHTHMKGLVRLELVSYTPTHTYT